MEKQKSLYYEKVKKYYYNIYDLQNYELNIAEFYSLEELTNYINKITNNNYNKETLRVMIANNQIINNRYEIIKDNINIIDNIES